MNLFITLAFLFFIGSLSGWCIEVVFRRFFSKNNTDKKWINPGACVGPYLPIYGLGLCALFLIAMLEKALPFNHPVWSKVALFTVMSVCMTLIEYIAGIISLKLNKLRLWDYSEEWGNIQGIICPKFSFFWAILGAIYYFLIHPHIINALVWLSHNLAFSFVVGVFFGIFTVDTFYSSQIIKKLKRYAKEENIIVRYEQLKSQIQAFREKTKQKRSFLLAMRTEKPLSEFLKEHKAAQKKQKK